MNKLQLIKKGLENYTITTQEKKNLKGGGWGNGGGSNGNGCPPPSVMEYMPEHP